MMTAKIVLLTLREWLSRLRYGSTNKMMRATIEIVQYEIKMIDFVFDPADCVSDFKI